MYVKKHIYIYGNSNSSEMLLLFFNFFFKRSSPTACRGLLKVSKVHDRFTSKFDEINRASD